MLSREERRAWQSDLEERLFREVVLEVAEYRSLRVKLKKGEEYFRKLIIARPSMADTYRRVLAKFLSWMKGGRCNVTNHETKNLSDL